MALKQVFVLNNQGGEFRKCLLHEGAGLGACFAEHPSLLLQLREAAAGKLPLIGEVVLVEEDSKGNGPEFFPGHGMEFFSGLERFWTRAVNHKEITCTTTEIGFSHSLELIIPVNIPKKEMDRRIPNFHLLAIDLDPDGREVLFGERSIDETCDEARFPHGEGTEHTDFLLPHRKGTHRRERIRLGAGLPVEQPHLNIKSTSVDGRLSGFLGQTVTRRNHYHIA
jgi:hypothetical protein